MRQWINLPDCRSWLVLTLLITAGCASPFEISVRHRESGANPVAWTEAGSFADYVAATRRMIAAKRLDVRGGQGDSIVEANSPYELPPEQSCPGGKTRRHARGVLLIHGLTDSPYQTRDIARYLHSRCFLVRAILLPGHGTVPGDMLTVERSEWVKQTRWAIGMMSLDVDSLYLAGFSTGGLLSLQAALSNPGVRGLILFSPALKIKSRLAFLSGMARYLRTWLEVAPDEDYAKYESFTTHAAYQIYRLTEEVSELRSSTRLVAPLFIALSADDATTESKETLTYFLRQGHPAGRLILYANNAPPDTNPRVRVVRSAHAEENILEQSHISTGIAPENPHYGRTGDYRNCKHYLYDRDAWDACKQARFIPKGERGAGKPPGTVFARLTYNPDFRNLTRELGQFLDRVETP